MEQRPIPEQDVERIVQLLMENSHFVASWDEIDDPSVMRVFGKKKPNVKVLLVILIMFVEVACNILWQNQLMRKECWDQLCGDWVMFG